MAKIRKSDVPNDTLAWLKDQSSAAGPSLSEFMQDEATKIASRLPLSEVLRRASTKPWGVAPGVAVAELRAIRDANAHL
jgi:hypothetical protein